MGGFVFDKFKRIFDQKSIPKHVLNEVLEVKIRQHLLKDSQRRAKKGKGAPKTATRRPKVFPLIGCPEEPILVAGCVPSLFFHFFSSFFSILFSSLFYLILEAFLVTESFLFLICFIPICIHPFGGFLGRFWGHFEHSEPQSVW